MKKTKPALEPRRPLVTLHAAQLVHVVGGSPPVKSAALASPPVKY